MPELSKLLGDLSRILGVCPCCGEIFYVSETHPYLEGHQPQSEVDKLREAEDRLARADEKLSELEWELREAAARAGLRTAKKILKKIDPTFSGAGYDPQDVKVIFDPVTYVVFDGLAKGKLKRISLLARPPNTALSERVCRSIDSAVQNGNVSWKTLRVDRGGAVSSQ